MNITPITLGTAQLTMPYGIANSRSNVSKESAFSLLENALANGINTWDTSPTYGRSEKIIGDFLKINNQPEVIICSKLPSIIKQYGKNITKDAIKNIVSKKIDKSLSSLQREKIEYYLIHDEQDFITFGSELVYALTECIADGRIDAIGISVYSPKIASIAFQEKKIKLIQLPLNVFDRRFERHIIEASAKDIKVFIRSVYLKGLFFLSLEICKKIIPLAHAPLKRLLQITHDYNLSITEIAFGYVRYTNGIKSMVLGMENFQQLNENVSLLDAPKMPAELINKINNQFRNIPIEVLDPSRWKK